MNWTSSNPGGSSFLSEVFVDPLTGEKSWYANHQMLLSKFNVSPADPKDMLWISANKVKMKVGLGLEGPVTTLYDSSSALQFNGPGATDINLCLRLSDAKKFFARLDQESSNQFTEKFFPTTQSHGENVTSRIYGMIYQEKLHVFRVSYQTILDLNSVVVSLLPVQIWLIVEAAPDFNVLDNAVIAYFCKIISS